MDDLKWGTKMMIIAIITLTLFLCYVYGYVSGYLAGGDTPCERDYYSWEPDIKYIVKDILEGE